MSSKAHADRLAKALESTAMCQAVDVTNTHDQVRVVLRIAGGAEGVWTQLVNQILTAGEYITGQAHSFNAHICKNYFRKQTAEGERKLVFGWYVSVQSNSMSESLDVIVRAIKGSLPDAPEERKEVTEMPLSTRARDLNAPTEKGKGGWTVGGKQDFKVR